MGEFEPTRWWQVRDANGLWCETSDETEARKAMKKGTTLWRLYIRKEYEWVEEKAEPYRPNPDLVSKRVSQGCPACGTAWSQADLDAGLHILGLVCANCYQ